jgi:hypothetical protein
MRQWGRGLPFLDKRVSQERTSAGTVLATRSFGGVYQLMMELSGELRGAAGKARHMLYVVSFRK